MSYTNFQVHLFHKNGDVWNTTVDEDLSFDSFNILVSKGIGSVKDSFSFDIHDCSRYFTPTKRIVNDDLIKIWAKKDSTSFADDDILIQGTVASIDFNETTSEEKVTISGYDFSEAMFDFQLPPRYLNLTCSEIVQTILNEDPIKTRGITFVAGGVDSNGNPQSGVTVVTTKKDGTSFPAKNMALTYTYVFEMFDKLASNEYTDDGQYIWYVTTAKEFVFKGKTTTTNTAINFDADLIDINSVKVIHKKEGLMNFIVFIAGTDLEGNPVESVWYNPTSIAKIGFKYYFAVEETKNCFDNAIQNEIQGYLKQGALSTTWGSNVVNTTDGTWVDQQTYPQPSNAVLSAGNTYTWIQKQLNDDNTETTLTSESDEEFNDHAVIIATQLGKNTCIDLGTDNSIPKYGVGMEIPFRNDFVLGDNYNVNIPQRGIENINLRLVSASYSVSGINISFEQDKGSFEEIQ